MATFGLKGPESCSGLKVMRYDPERLHAALGPRFEEIRSVEEWHKTPVGTEQQFVYGYYQRRK